MSKSMKRVRATLEAAGVTTEIRETALARTAVDAATALGCEVDQIAKSIVLRGENSGAALLFITAGAQQVDLTRAAALAGEPLGKAEGPEEDKAKHHGGDPSAFATGVHPRFSPGKPVAAAAIGRVGGHCCHC